MTQLTGVLMTENLEKIEPLKRESTQVVAD